MTLVNRSPAIGPFLPSMRAEMPTPAQFTSRLMPPSFWRAVSIAAFTSASEVTSQRMNVAAPPSSAAAAWPGPSCTSSTAARPPLATIRRATAFPRPEAPPVTTARASEIFMLRFLSSSHAEDAVAFVGRGRSVRCGVEREAQHAPCIHRVDDAVIPQARCGVVRVALRFIRGPDPVDELALLLFGPGFAARLHAVATHGGEHLRSLLAAHHGDA